MTDGEGAHEDVRYLTGSPQRPRLLAALCRSAYRPTDLTEEVDATRTTVQRVLAGFRDRDWVTKRDGRYRATLTGRRVHERYAALRAEVERAREFGPLARHLDEELADLPESALAEAEMCLATARKPLAAVDRLLAWFDETDADHVRCVSPVVARSFNEAAAELIADGVRVDLVIDEATLERSLAEFGADTERGLEDRRANVFVSSEPLSVGLAVGDRSACLGVYDEENNLRGLLVSRDDAFRDWALSEYENRRAAALPLRDVLDDD